MSIKSKAAMLQDIKAIGQSIIDNAEKILNNYDYQTSIEIFATLSPTEAVELQITNSFVPKKIVERFKVGDTN